MKKNYVLTLLLTLFISGLSFGQVFITELADPNNNLNARYVELYNAGESSVDLSTWRLDKYTNTCLLYTSPSPRDRQKSRMPSSA